MDTSDVSGVPAETDGGEFGVVRASGNSRRGMLKATERAIARHARHTSAATARAAKRTEAAVGKAADAISDSVDRSANRVTGAVEAQTEVLSEAIGCVAHEIAATNALLEQVNSSIGKASEAELRALGAIQSDLRAGLVTLDRRLLDLKRSVDSGFDRMQSALADVAVRMEWSDLYKRFMSFKKNAFLLARSGDYPRALGQALQGLRLRDADGLIDDSVERDPELCAFVMRLLLTECAGHAEDPIPFARAALDRAACSNEPSERQAAADAARVLAMDARSRRNFAEGANLDFRAYELEQEAPVRALATAVAATIVTQPADRVGGLLAQASLSEPEFAVEFLSQAAVAVYPTQAGMVIGSASRALRALHSEMEHSCSEMDRQWEAIQATVPGLKIKRARADAPPEGAPLVLLAATVNSQMQGSLDALRNNVEALCARAGESVAATKQLADQLAERCAALTEERDRTLEHRYQCRNSSVLTADTNHSNVISAHIFWFFFSGGLGNIILFLLRDHTVRKFRREQQQLHERYTRAIEPLAATSRALAESWSGLAAQENLARQRIEAFDATMDVASKGLRSLKRLDDLHVGSVGEDHRTRIQSILSLVEAQRALSVAIVSTEQLLRNASAPQPAPQIGTVAGIGNFQRIAVRPTAAPEYSRDNPQLGPTSQGMPPVQVPSVQHIGQAPPALPATAQPVEIPMARREDGLLLARITDATLLRGELYLSVTGLLEPQVSQMLAGRAKLASWQQFASIAHATANGLRLLHSHPPPGMPGGPLVLCFKVEKTPGYWEDVARTLTLAVLLGAVPTTANVALCAVAGPRA